MGWSVAPFSDDVCPNINGDLNGVYGYLKLDEIPNYEEKRPQYRSHHRYLSHVDQFDDADHISVSDSSDQGSKQIIGSSQAHFQ